MEKGLWKGHYASTTANEYWAEGTQTWFWSNYEYVDGDQHVMSPDDLKRVRPEALRPARPRLPRSPHPDGRLPRQGPAARAAARSRLIIEES